MKTKNNSHQKQELMFLQMAKERAYLLAKEIESINIMIEKTKQEKLFCEKYTRNFQAQFAYHQVIFQYEKMKKHLIKSKLHFECISHKPININ